MLATTVSVASEITLTLPELSFETNISPIAGSYARYWGSSPTAICAEVAPLDATTVSAPKGATGTVNVQGVPLVPGKLPVPSVAQEDATPMPAKEKEIVEFAGNPVPVAFTTVPAYPVVGETTRPAPTSGR